MDGSITKQEQITSSAQMKTTRSSELMELSEAVIPGGVNSPVRAFKAVGGVPRFIKRANGAYLYDVDDNRYLDFCCSWGPLIFGHADPDVVAAIQAQATDGLSYGACTEHEYRLAEFITSHVDAVEKIRFVSSGTEAVMSAVRLARGYTKRELIVKFEGCYHGHSDYLLVKAGSGLATFAQPSSAGVPTNSTSDTIVLPLDNDAAVIELFKRQGDRIAAVIIEGIPANNGLLVQRPEFMKLLRQLTERNGALMILDEVITGFRIGLSGAAGMYNITPDLLTYGKIIGGGLPVGAFGGRADIMDLLSPLGPVYQAGTLSGNPLAMVAGLTTLKKLSQENVYAELAEKTFAFTRLISDKLSGTDFQIVSVASLFWIVFQADAPRAAAQIQKEAVERYNTRYNMLLDAGIYFPPSAYEVCFVSTAHTKEALTEAATVFSEIMN